MEELQVVGYVPVPWGEHFGLFISPDRPAQLTVLVIGIPQVIEEKTVPYTGIEGFLVAFDRLLVLGLLEESVPLIIGLRWANLGKGDRPGKGHQEKGYQK